MSARVESGNLLAGLPEALAEEELTTLVSCAGFKLVRIVSTGQASPEGEWYDQDQAEWVMVVRGSAGLRIEGEARARSLRAGDYLRLPAHVRHRIEWTDPNQPTVWLALHHQD